MCMTDVCVSSLNGDKKQLQSHTTHIKQSLVRFVLNFLVLIMHYVHRVHQLQPEG